MSECAHEKVADSHHSDDVVAERKLVVDGEAEDRQISDEQDRRLQHHDRSSSKTCCSVLVTIASTLVALRSRA